jgi:hypothetical protein
MKGLNGRMVKSDVVGRISHLPSEGDLLRPRRVVTLEAHFLLNDLWDEGLQAPGQELDRSSVVEIRFGDLTVSWRFIPLIVQDIHEAA